MKVLAIHVSIPNLTVAQHCVVSSSTVIVSCNLWRGAWRSGWGVGHATPKVAGSTPGLVLSNNNLGQVVHTRVLLPLSLSGII